MASRSEVKTVSSAVMSTSPPELNRDGDVADFEKLLSDLSAAFIRVPVEEIDREIERWLQ